MEPHYSVPHLQRSHDTTSQILGPDFAEYFSPFNIIGENGHGYTVDIFFHAQCYFTNNTKYRHWSNVFEFFIWIILIEKMKSCGLRIFPTGYDRFLSRLQRVIVLICVDEY